MKLIKKLGTKRLISRNDKIYIKRFALFKCQYCGNEVERQIANGKRANSCGCFQGKDITGQVFGRLTAIKPTNKRKGTAVIWKCSCSCGSVSYAAAGGLIYGDVQSCGCLQRERAAEAQYKHGDSRTQIYLRWSGIHFRCNHKPYYADVAVCDEWQGAQGYLNFKKWVFNQGYDEDSIKSVDIHRINDSKIYSPETCELIDRSLHHQLHINEYWASAQA